MTSKSRTRALLVMAGLLALLGMAFIWSTMPRAASGRQSIAPVAAPPVQAARPQLHAPAPDPIIEQEPEPSPVSIAPARPESPPDAGVRIPASVARSAPAVSEAAPIAAAMPQPDAGAATALLPSPRSEGPLPSRPRAPAVLPPVPDVPAPPITTAVEPPPRAPIEMAAVQTVLDRYRQMYSQLDAAMATAIWPQADTRALERVFSRLERQELDFDDCVIALSEVSATAQCAGRLRYIPRVGSSEWRTETHAWTIQLQRSNDVWTIVGVSAR